jgi:RNA polymerase sigma-70 factor (ECF subfamily)
MGAVSPELVDAFAAELDGVHRALRRFGVSGSDVEDVAQEVFLVMWRRWRDFDRGRPLRPWVVGIAFRVAGEHRRRARREVPVGLIDLADGRPAPDQALAAQRARALVRAALGALSDKQRTVMILHDLDGVAMPDIARALSEPLTTLYSRLIVARRSFARAVQRMGRQPARLGALLPTSWLSLEKQPDPMPPEMRARLLRRVRALLAAPVAPGGGGVAPGRLAVGAAAAAVAAVLALFAARAPADAGAPGAAAPDDGAHAPAAALAPASTTDPSRARRGAITLAATLPPALAPEPPGTAELARGLVGYWRFDEAPGATAARDSSSQGTACLLRRLDPAVAWVPGRLGGGLDLDGRGWLECADPRFGRTPDLTVAAWVKRTRPQRGLRVLATRQLGSGPRDHFFFGFAGDRLSVASHVWNGTLRHPLPRAPGAADGVALNQWVHLALVHRDGRVKLFIDGQLLVERRSYAGRTVAAATPLMIGAGANGPDPAVTTQHLAATLDELVVYQRALSDREIAALADGAQPAETW